VAPRVALFAACGALTLFGFVRTFAPTRSTPQVASVARAEGTTEEQALAERFAAEYLSLTPDQEYVRDGRLRALGLVDSAASGDRVGSRRMRPTQLSTAAVLRVRGGVDVTVAVSDGQGWRYLAVPVRRTTEGLTIGGPPALVGPPRIAINALSRPEDEVSDADLKQVVARVVRHYVAGERTDLAADLSPRAVVTTPATDLRVASVEAVTWAAAPRRVAAVVQARGRDGLNLMLRYELAVVRRGGRWLVTAVAGNPTTEEQGR
jgi:hypothetical protein